MYKSRQISPKPIVFSWNTSFFLSIRENLIIKQSQNNPRPGAFSARTGSLEFMGSRPPHRPDRHGCIGSLIFPPGPGTAWCGHPNWGRAPGPGRPGGAPLRQPWPIPGPGRQGGCPPPPRAPITHGIGGPGHQSPPAEDRHPQTAAGKDRRGGKLGHQIPAPGTGQTPLIKGCIHGTELVRRGQAGGQTGRTGRSDNILIFSVA